jgi:hypothetical protein
MEKTVDLTTFVNIIFKDKKNWSNLTVEDKEANFFIFNRFMSKKYPKQAYSFNKKHLNKAICADIWFHFLKKEISIPFWFWKYKQAKKTNNLKEYENFMIENEISQKQLLYLQTYHSDILKEEFDRYNEILKLINKT